MDKKRKTWFVLPLFMLAYLCFIGYIGRGNFVSGNYLLYFGVLGVSLIVICLLAYVLYKKEQMRNRRNRDEEPQYGTYADEDKKSDSDGAQKKD